MHAYPSMTQRLFLAHSLGANVGLQALFGPTRALDTVGGFAAWRSLGMLTIIGSIWGVLTGTWLLRCEEEAGRWETLVSARLTRRRAAAAGVTAAGLLVAELFVLTTLGTLLGAAAGHLSITSCLFLDAALVAPAALVLAVGILAGQLLGTRSGAARVAGALFGVAYLVRLVGVAAHVGWLRWITPLGWIDATHPMTGSAAVPLVLSFGLTFVLAGVAVVVADRRDLGAGVRQRRREARGGTALLGGPAGLAIRLTGPSALGWLASVATISVVLGLVSKSVGESTAKSQFVNGYLDRLGVSHAGSLAELGLAMLTVSAMIALSAAGAASAVRETESVGLADAVLVTPVARTRWLAVRAAVSAVTLTLLGVTVASVLCLATAGQDLGISAGQLFAAGMNTVPVAVLVLGAGLLVFATAPRLTSVAVYGLVAWSFLDELVGGAVNAPNWVLDLSLFHHIALAPAADPRWATNAVLVAIGVGCAALGVGLFARRDLVLS